MKSMFLSVIVICALAVSGVGGTLATWSDSETSPDNYIETGSVDLQVNYADDEPWGTGVPTKFMIECMIPCKIYGPYPVDVWNAGQCEQPSSLFIHLKEACCANIPPKDGSGYPDPVSGDLCPEPELVAQHGGKVNCTEVPGVGVIGEDCTLLDHIYVWILLDDGSVVYEGKMDEIICQEMYICELWPCEPRQLLFFFHLQQEPEETYGLNLIPNPGEAGHDPMLWAKFNDWPSWALMKDRVEFDMEFDLWLIDP
jgi:predicted ribosomally synthesized peptide with SipW-like signal peptide